MYVCMTRHFEDQICIIGESAVKFMVEKHW